MEEAKEETTTGETELKLESPICIEEWLEVASVEKLTCGFHPCGLWPGVNQVPLHLPCLPGALILTDM